MAGSIDFATTLVRLLPGLECVELGWLEMYVPRIDCRLQLSGQSLY